MAQLEVYHIPPEHMGTGSEVLLPPEEAHHLLRVRRARQGDELMLIDGLGNAWRAQLLEASPDTCKLSLLEHFDQWREPSLEIHLGLGVIKPDAFMEAVNLSVQAGVSSITPLRCNRTVAKWHEKKSERARRVSLSATKQCGRGLIVPVEQEQPPAKWCIQRANDDHRLLLDPEGGPLPRLAAGDRVSLAVGPEGGFDEDEVDAFEDQGFVRVSLGRRRLRAEAAAFAAIALAALPLEQR